MIDGGASFFALSKNLHLYRETGFWVSAGKQAKKPGVVLVRRVPTKRAAAPIAAGCAPMTVIERQCVMIEFDNVSKTYDNGTKALRNVSLKIDKGEFVFIVGSSGAGKSTFLKLIMREEMPNSGEIIVNGRKLSTVRHRDVPYLRRTMGIVFQDFRLIDKMTVYGNVAFAMYTTGASDRDVRKRVPYILGLVGLQAKAMCHPSELSGGEQQRVGLARALVNNPSLIIADEPTGNVDPAMSFEIVELLTEINRRGTTVLMVTHEHSLVRRFPRRVIEIKGGTIVGDSGKPEVEYED